jgi:hypothetical protein
MRLQEHQHFRPQPLRRLRLSELQVLPQPLLQAHCQLPHLRLLQFQLQPQ